MAEAQSAHFPEHCNNLTRRDALSGATHVGGALAMVGALPLVVLAEHAGEAALADPHVAWWAERRRLDAELKAVNHEYDVLTGDMLSADFMEHEHKVDALWQQRLDIARQIATTTPEGAAIIAAVLVAGFDEKYVPWETLPTDSPELEEEARATLARHILNVTPADVLVRAGVRHEQAHEAGAQADGRRGSATQRPLRVLLMRLYQDHRNESPETYEERNADLMQFNYLADLLVVEVAALETAFYDAPASSRWRL